VGQVVEGEQGLLDDIVGLFALHVDNETNAARVVLKASIVKAFFFSVFADLFAIHKSSKYVQNPKGKWGSYMP